MTPSAVPAEDWGFSLPVKGFLGTGATFDADVNLVVQLVMGAALVAGVILAKQRCYRAHGVCQTTVLLLNLLMIGLVMWPSFRRQGNPIFPRVLHRSYYAAPTVHEGPWGILDSLVAGTRAT